MNKNQTGNLRTIGLFSVVVLAIMFLVAAWAWAQIPAGTSIPVHWGPNGEADRYGGKFEGLLLLPLISIFLVLLFAFIPRIDPRGANIVRSNKAYSAIWAVTLLFMLAIYVAGILSTLGWPVDIGRIIGPGVGILFMVMGNYLGKIRINYMLGIRTPWTLASELSWNKTHRLGGKLFVALGLLMLATSFFAQGALLIYVIIGGVLLTTVGLFAYSYVIWKSDPAISVDQTKTA